MSGLRLRRILEDWLHISVQASLICQSPLWAIYGLGPGQERDYQTRHAAGYLPIKHQSKVNLANLGNIGSISNEVLLQCCKPIDTCIFAIWTPVVACVPITTSVSQSVSQSVTCMFKPDKVHTIGKPLLYQGVRQISGGWNQSLGHRLET